MSKKSAAERLIETKPGAAAFLEDLGHVRDIVRTSDKADAGEIRRLSNVLRRLLIDNGGDLRSIAPPRIGRFTIASFDNGPVLKSEARKPIAFYQSGGGAIFGVYVRAALIEANQLGEPPGPRPLPDFDPERTISLPLDNFLAQKLICYRESWATRGQIIKYVANVASGVHTGTPRESFELLLNRARRAVSYSMQQISVPDGSTAEALNLAADMDVIHSNADLPFRYDPGHVDPTLVELLAVAQLLLNSPDIAKLESVIRAEFRLQN
jgi:hypothetical protein